MLVLIIVRRCICSRDFITIYCLHKILRVSFLFAASIACLFATVQNNRLKCKVNVILCTCSLYDNRNFFYPVKNNKMNMISVLEGFNKKEEEIFDRENRVSYGFSANNLQKHIGVFPSVKLQFFWFYFIQYLLFLLLTLVSQMLYVNIKNCQLQKFWKMAEQK